MSVNKVREIKPQTQTTLYAKKTKNKQTKNENTNQKILLIFSVFCCWHVYLENNVYAHTRFLFINTVVLLLNVFIFSHCVFHTPLLKWNSGMLLFNRCYSSTVNWNDYCCSFFIAAIHFCALGITWIENWGASSFLNYLWYKFVHNYSVLNCSTYFLINPVVRFSNTYEEQTIFCFIN